MPAKAVQMGHLSKISIAYVLAIIGNGDSHSCFTIKQGILSQLAESAGVPTYVDHYARY